MTRIPASYLMRPVLGIDLRSLAVMGSLSPRNVFGKAPKNQAMDEAEGMTGWIDDLSGTTGPGQGRET